MVTMKEVLQYRIHQLSEQINALKTANYKKDANGKPTMIGERIITDLSPKHPAWEQYKALKKETSKFLTALRIWKRFLRIPKKAELRDAIRAGAFQNHAGKGTKAERNLFIFEAFSMLQGGCPEIDRKAAEEYAAKRAEEVAHAKQAS